MAVHLDQSTAAALRRRTPRGPSALAFVLIGMGATLAVGSILLALIHRAEAAAVIADRRERLAEAYAKEQNGDLSWAVAAYTALIDEAPLVDASVEDAPRDQGAGDDTSADALVGRARCHVSLGDREAAAADVRTVLSSSVASEETRGEAKRIAFEAGFTP